jgi:predicted ATPase/DNA-binding CsgD family transcriptional regulator
MGAGYTGMSPEQQQVRGNLPQELNSFVGREHELDELCRLIGTARALTLCGVGGIGKTRLAVRVLAAAAGGFPDGVWFIELGDLRQPELVVARVASVVGVDEEPGRPLIETLCDALRPRRLLVALDNCEHLIEACAGVCHRLLAASPGLRLIATSREPLRVAAETVWQVPPLPVPPAGAIPPAGAVPPAEAIPAGVVSLVDSLSSTAGTAGRGAAGHDAASSGAIRLFADRAAASHPGFVINPANAAAVAALCRALDGIPLAIELAAAWVRVLSVEQIAKRLADRFRLLTTGGRTAPPRQRTLRATIDWSHELLTAAERVLLRRLSVFAGWSLEMAEQVCCDDEIPARDMLDLIAALVDKSLVVVEPEALGQARYRLLDTIREYAAERLADAGESTAFQLKLRDYTLGVAERNMAVGMAQIPAPWPARVDIFRRYDVDVGNVRQVLSGCLNRSDVETGMRICTAVRPCWIVRGAFAEGGEWLDSFLSLAAPSTSPAVLGPALVGRAQLALSADPVAAESWAEEGLELCRAAGDDFWQAGALNLLSEIALHTGRSEEAESFAAAALAGAQATGDGWNEGYALGTRAAIAAQRGALREAHQLAKASIAVMRRIDQQWGVARTLLGLGDLARLRGDPSEARSMYVDALVIIREVDARPEIARCLAGLGRVAMDRGAAGHAKQHLAESLRLSHSTGSRIGIVRGLEGFAALAVQENRPERAVQLAAAATALREAAGLPALSGARIERYLAPARRLGEPAVGRLWAHGMAMSSDAAVALALDVREPAAVTGRGTAAGGDEAIAAVPGTLTPRERQIVALVVNGRSNRAIAEELFISPATAARHIANILAKLGFTSRTQIAAWAADKDLELTDPAAGAAPAQGA